MELGLGFTCKEITPWAEMAVVKRMLDYIDLDAALHGAKLPQPDSNRGYAPKRSINSCSQCGLVPIGSWI